jgi:hypothetical protein
MTLIIQKPTGAKLNLAQTYVGIDDPDAAVYVAAVEAADTAAGQSGGLETATKVAIHSFVMGCKADGIWPAIKASCILAGARTLTGALIPLAGTAPTNVGGLFVSGDYDRKIGLVGDASTKYLNSNRASNADPNTSIHQSIWVNTATSGVASYIGTGSASGSFAGSVVILTNNTSNELAFRSRNLWADVVTSAATRTGFIGQSRSNGSDFISRSASANTTFTRAAEASQTLSHYVFARNSDNAISSASNGRLAFYSIGESLNLALLDARVTTLINAFAAAIP